MVNKVQTLSAGNNWPVKLPILSVWFIGIIATALFTWMIHQQNKDDIQTRVEQLTDVAEQLVIKRFELYKYGLLGLRGAMLAADIRQISGR
jgi:hypothetical protein